MSVNKVFVLGRLGQNPEVKHLAGGGTVCQLSVATSESWVGKDGQKQEKTEWHRVVCWNKLAEICSEYLEKGREVFVEGKVQTRSWEAEDGTKRYSTEILASRVEFVGGRSNKAESSGFDSNEEIPF